jgi:hypothetical protein
MPTYLAFIDVKKAFPSAFKAGILVKLYRLGITGKCWRMLRDMYSTVHTRILTGQESDFSEEELEQLYYELETGLREGSILSPVLYLLFINGFVEELYALNLGVTVVSTRTGKSMWIGALMYCDDAVVVCNSPGELQIALDLLTTYAKKWRFKTHPIKSQVMCCCESPTQRQSRTLKEWWLMNQSIKEVSLYIYLGIILTPDLDFTQHIKVTLQAAYRQGREALLLGVRRGELHPERARKVWRAFVEPKFGYGIGHWLAGCDSKAMTTIDRIQCIGAQQLLGVDVPSKWTCRPPSVSMLMESGLSPACVLRAQGLLRLWRVAQTREPDSLLGLAWSMGEEYKVRLGKECINTAVDEINREYCSTIEWPEPNLRKEWKQAIGKVSARVRLKWYREQVTNKLTGRRAEYSRIREAEIRAEYSQQTGPHTAPQIAQHVADTIPITPAPFTALALRPLEVSLITRMRCHMSSCIRTHIGHQTHVLRGTRYPPIHHSLLALTHMRVLQWPMPRR